MQLQLNYFDFSDLPGRKNNLPALDARRAWKSLSPKTDTDDLNSFKSSSEKKNNLFVIHCSRNSYMEWHRFVFTASAANRFSVSIPSDFSSNLIRLSNSHVF